MFSYDLPSLTIMYKGIYDYTKLYLAIQDWFNAYMYEWHEKTVKNKEDNMGDEIELKGYGDKKVDEWAKYTINVHILNSDAEYVEKEVNGKKKTLVLGRIRIRLDAKLDLDYQKNYEVSKLWKKMEDKIVKPAFDQDIFTKYWDDLYYVNYSLHALIKEVLNMDTAGHNY